MGSVRSEPDDDSAVALTLWQRMAMARLRRSAGRHPGEPLSADDWPALWTLNHTTGARSLQRMWRLMPSETRCALCNAPFAGPWRHAPAALGYRPSRKNPHFCSTCVELSPPGGTVMRAGIFFADIRGFTAASERSDPEAVSKTLRRFYGHAEAVLFPEAIIDKLIGDEVMALYLEPLLPKADIPALMVDHAARLLEQLGSGTHDGPFVEVGIGLDYGEAFVGNIGDRAVFDFTAVGDIVNTAARLQGEARGGEVMISSRVESALPTSVGARVEVILKGKSAPEVAYRIPRAV